MTSNSKQKFMQFLTLGVKLNPGEGRSISAMFSSLFFIMMTGYILKPAREMLILTEGSAEIRSYAVALQAVLLLFFIPLYSKFSRKYPPGQYMQIIVVICAATLVGFFIAGKLGFHISTIYFVWLGAYGVLIVAQFWAYASELYNKDAGERLFAIVAFGASTGALVGSWAANVIVRHLDAHSMILLGGVTLLIAGFPARWASKSVPLEDMPRKEASSEDFQSSIFAGFKLVFSVRYLYLIAIFVVVFNLVNSTGEYLLSALLEFQYDELILENDLGMDKGTYIGLFYTNFFFVVNLCGFLLQFLVVSRLINKAGFNLAFAATPLLIFLGYSFLAIVPVILVFQIVKTTENSLDYSLQNTTKQMLYLPLSRQAKYEARAVIDTIGYRFGDMLHAGLIFVGLNYFEILPRQFVPVVTLLSGITLFVAIQVILERKKLLSEYSEETVLSDGMKSPTN